MLEPPGDQADHYDQPARAGNQVLKPQEREIRGKVEQWKRAEHRGKARAEMEYVLCY